MVISSLLFSCISALIIQRIHECINSSLVESARKAQQAQIEQLCSTDGTITQIFFFFGHCLCLQVLVEVAMKITQFPPQFSG